MKRCIALVLTMLVLLSACGQKISPEQKVALPEQLEGIWTVTIGSTPEYYLFQDDNIYYATGADIQNAFDTLLSDTLEQSGLADWKAMDFQNALEKLDLNDLFYLISSKRIEVQDNTVIISRNFADERHIIASDEGVTYQAAAAVGVSLEMTQLADRADLSIERFERIFQATKAACTAPAAHFWPTTAQYSAQLRKLHPEVDTWRLASETEDSVIYTPEGTIDNVSGSFLVTDKIAMLSKGRATTNGSPFVVLFDPAAPGAQVVVKDRYGADLLTLLQYIEMAVAGFPGAISAKQLHQRFQNSASYSDGVYQFDQSIKDIRYQIYVSDRYTTIMVSAEEQISLADLLKEQDSGNTKPVTPPSDPGSTDPEPTDPSCEHRYSDATCTAPKTCTRCGQTTGAALGHSFIGATCTTPKTCVRCGATSGSAAGHSWKEASCVTAKFCTICGESTGSALAHTYIEATCTSPRICSGCYNVEGEPLGHDYAPATCTEPKTCTRCGETSGSAAGHRYSGTVSCTVPKNCTVCGATVSGATGHTWKDATCLTAKICTVCGETSGSALGHDYTPATCTDPKTCTRCGAVDGRALGHSYADASCTTAKTCTVCGKTSGSVPGHGWQPITETIYHEEQGHYEEEEHYKEVTKYRCFFCGYNNPTFDSLDTYYSHYDSNHTGANINMREHYDTFEEWECYTETKWVVDVPAYDETVVIGYVCTVCGKEKEP